MENVEQARGPYVVPRYRDEGDPAWYHVLHGTVPGHQIDFMYCPHVPQGHLTQTHFGHLARLIKYIEPRRGAPFAFALGNLSRDDIQHEAGHGGLALIFALRVAGVTDHAGRDMPPYAHGVIAIDRALDYTTLLDAITAFYRRFLDNDPRAQDATGSFYRSYVRVMEERREAAEQFLHDYVTDFDELPQPPRSKLGFDWEADEAALPKRVTIVHDDDEPFSGIADAAAMLGAMLYKSNIKWTAVTNGEVEVPGGIPIRLVPASEAPRNPSGLVLSLSDLPADEAELAATIFGAKAREVDVKVTRAGWREALGAQKKVEEASAAVAVAGMARQPSTRPPPASVKPAAPATPPPPPPDAASPGTPAFDEAATIPVSLEADPAAPGESPQSSPRPGAAKAFDPRRSSPTTGVPAAFDPRRSSPTTGVPAAAKSSPGAGAAPGVKSTPPPAKSAVVSVPPPASTRTADIPLSEPPPAMRPRTGMWIGILGGVAVVVVILVTVMGSGSEGGSTSGDPPAVSGQSTASSSTAAPPATAPVPPAVDPGSTGGAAAPPDTRAPATGTPGTETSTPSKSPAPPSTPTGTGASTSKGTRSPPKNDPFRRPLR